ncbi:MAG: UDP-glucuronosyltransferase [Candidatus Nitrosotenuis sp.]|nr:MAG: UDP-glucuronosyltransferase [Candidatus Nitrosotenuis sp.]
MTDKLDVGFFCSPTGLGHATRDIAIAQHFDGILAKFVTGNGAAKLFAEYGFSVNDSYVTPKFKIENGVLQKPLKWLFTYYQYYKKCSVIAKEFVRKENPKVIVSDEDFASLVIAQQNKIPSILITDILETKFTRGIGSLIEKKMNQSMREIIQKCNVVIMPEFGQDQDNIKRVGPIVRTTKYSRDELRKQFSFSKKTITLSVGGSDAGRFLIEKTIDVFSKLKIDADLVVVPGPSLKLDTQNIRNLGFVNNLHEIIYASDLVISLAGKSTIDEARAYGTPGIFIPVKNHFEQEDNAKQEGYQYDDVLRLGTLIPQKLESARAPVETNGASRAYEIIRKYLA